MAYFDLIYVSAERGKEEEALARLKPVVAELYGIHHVRTKRGSGWVQLQREDDPLERLEFEEILDYFKALKDHPEWFPPTDEENARALSGRLGVDVVYFSAATAADAVMFTRCRGGKIVRSFVYCSQDEKNDGWSEEEGAPEPWEAQWAKPLDGRRRGPDVTDIGAALGLSGMDRSYLVEGFSWDVDTTVSGRRWDPPGRPRSLLGRISRSPARWVAPALLLAVLGWVVARRRKQGAR